MMQTNLRRLSISLFIPLLLFLLLACNSVPGADSNDALPTLAPTAIPVDNITPPENSNADSNSDAPADNAGVEQSQGEEEETAVEAVEQTNENNDNVAQTGSLEQGTWTADARLIPFDTFEFGYRIESTQPDGTVQFVSITVENSKPDSITLWTPSVQGVQDSDFLNEVRLGVFAESSFMYAPQMGCIWSNEGGSNNDMLAFNTDSFLSFDNQPDAQFVGMETVNGLETFVYEVGQQTLVNDFPSNVTITEATGRFNIYQFPTGEQLIIKSSLEMISNYDIFGETVSDAPNIITRFNSEIRNINQPIEVLLPAECEQQADNFPYPIYPGGFVQASMPDFAIVQVETGDKAEISTWYQAEMVAAGWVQTGLQDLGQIILIDFQMNNQAVSVSIADDPTSGGIAISFINN